MNHRTEQEDDAQIMKDCGNMVIAALIVVTLAAVILMVVTKFNS